MLKNRELKQTISINIDIDESNTTETVKEDDRDTTYDGCIKAWRPMGYSCSMNYYESMRLLVEELMQKETDLLNEFMEKVNADENIKDNKVNIKIQNPYAAYLKDYIVLMGNHDLKVDDYMKQIDEDLKNK